MLRRSIASSALLAISLFVNAAPAPPPQAATLAGTQRFALRSTSVGDTFQIDVGLPLGYDDSSDRTYPVLYVLDANGMFGTALETAQIAQPSGQLPDMIVVGIGYPVDNFKQTWGLRMRDYAPVGDPEHFYAKMVERMLPNQPASIHSGGAARFLKFIREELKPLIAKRYRADPDDSAIFGDSLGGTFALYALFEAPDTFQRYAIGSPAAAWGNGYLYRHEAAFAEKKQSLPARVFISAGSDESDSYIAEHLQMVAAIRKHAYPQLQLSTRLFPGEDHISVIPLNISHGLRAIFARHGQEGR